MYNESVCLVELSEPVCRLISVWLKSTETESRPEQPEPACGMLIEGNETDPETVPKAESDNNENKVNTGLSFFSLMPPLLNTKRL